MRSSVMLCELFNAEVSEDISELRASASWLADMYSREMIKKKNRADWDMLRLAIYRVGDEFLMYPEETAGKLNKPGNPS